MKYTSRRGLLSAGAGFAVLSAGCLGRLSDDDGDGSENTDESDGSDLSPLERWVPASGSSELLFHYRDLTAVRQYEDALRTDVVESVPTLPDGESSEFVEQVADGEPAVDAVCRFGSKGVVGNVVVSGSFDPGAVDADRESVAGDFEVLERDGVSVAVSEETVVVSPSDGADLDAVLAAGLEGTDRRIDAHGNFAQLTDRVGDSTFLWGEYEGSDDGSGAAFSWTLGAETTTYSGLAVYADADKTAEFEETMSERFDDVTVEVDGAVGVATRTVPTQEYEYRGLFAERGSQPTRPQAGVSIDSDPSDRTVTVTYVSRGSTVDRLEISDESGNEAEMTRVGETMTFEYDAGASGELTVVAVGSETEVVVATYTYSF